MNIFVARQPIFDRDQRVYAYELLYRSGENNYYDGTNGDKATSNVINNSFVVIGIDNLTGGKRAFINFTENLLKGEIVTLLPKELLTVEILENVKLDSCTLENCEKIKGLGYELVLDDFILQDDEYQRKFLDLVDIIKIDFQNTAKAERRRIVTAFQNKNIKFLAEKVETRQEFKEAYESGYSFFQGYFFSKPEIFKGKTIQSDKLHYLEMITEVNQAEVDFDHLESIIKRDVAISYKLLKYINSVGIGRGNTINSIKQAIVFMGIRELKKWITLVVYGILGVDQPNELTRACALRARFGELLSLKSGFETKSSEVFIVGMLSAIDVILEEPMEQILRSLPVPEDVALALQYKKGPIGIYYEITLAYERGDWDLVKELSKEISMDYKEIPELYIQALKWTNQFGI